MRQATSIANRYYTSLIDLEDVQKMLNIIPFGYDNVWVTIVVRDDDWYPDKVWEEDGVLYVTANLDKNELKDRLWLPVQLKDKVLRLLGGWGIGD